MCDKPILFAADSSKKCQLNAQPQTKIDQPQTIDQVQTTIIEQPQATVFEHPQTTVFEQPQTTIERTPENIRKRRSLTIKEKLDLLNMIDNGYKLTAVAREYGISSSTASTIVKERHKIKLISDHYNIDPERKRMRLGIYRDVDEAVHIWFRQMRMKNIPINGPMLQQKAREFALQLGHSNFEGSSGWLFRFRERHGLSVKTMRLNDDNNIYNCSGVGMTDDEIVTSVCQNTTHSFNFQRKDNEIPHNYFIPEIELTHSESNIKEQFISLCEINPIKEEAILSSEETIPSLQEAIVFTEKLTSFLKEHDVPSDVLKSMNSVSNYIVHDLKNQLKQKRITDYFKTFSKQP